MAIVQISKIIHRTGANIDLPQLDTGEIGFASDTKRLYIGNDSIIHPPGSPDQTTQTEILTDSSVIRFDQLAGSATTTLNISGNVENGQVLVVNNSTWTNGGGTAGGLINLGNVANVKVSGGVNGYVLTTDGAGNLAWTTNGIIRYEIQNINFTTGTGSPSHAVVVTTKTAHLLPTGATVTIMGVSGSSIQTAIDTSGITLDIGGGTYVSSNRFYVKRLTDTTFALYTDSNAITNQVDGRGWDDTTPYVSGTGYALGFVPPAGTSAPGGSATQLQFNTSGGFDGSTNLTFNKVTNLLTVGGNVTATTVTANINGNFDGRVGYYSPNSGAFTSITATTTLTATGNVTGGNVKTLGTANVGTFIVTGISTLANASIANVKSDNILYANGVPWPIGAGYTGVSGSDTQIQFNDTGTFAGSANLVFNKTTKIFTVDKITANGSLLTNLTGANVEGTVSLAAVANSVAGANVSGTVAQATYATTANSVSWSNVAGKPTFSTVATSGSYTDLSSKPTIPDAQIQSDWNITDNALKSFIVNKPTIPAAQIQSDWAQVDNTLKDFIKNKPTIPAAQIQSDWSQAGTGSLDFIKNKPTIPAAQIQSDWNITDNTLKSFIANKPTIPAAQIQSDWNVTDNTLKSFIANKPLTGVLPQVLLYNQTNVNRTLLLTDAGKHVYIKSETNLYSANVVIPINFSVAFTIGTKIDVINSPYSETSSYVKVSDSAIVSLFLAGYEAIASPDDPVEVKPGEIVHLLKVEEDTWIVERKR